MAEASIRIENRAQLIYLLTEASELEHGISCCYMFAAFGIKSDVKEGVTPEQLAIIRRWRGTIMQIAIEEMVHYALACNLLTSVGAAPHIHRPNMPSSPQAYPPSFKLELAPFCRDTLAAFVFVERPQEEDAGSGAPLGSAFLPQNKLSDIFSSERQYQTVGALYKGIQDGFRYLSQKFGEDQLFIGPPEAQVADAYFNLPGLISVTDLESAIAAIQGIVDQGEGARDDNENSHHGRFKAMLEEYDQLLKEDPNFEPARHVMMNPYAMLPSDVGPDEDTNLIDDPLSADVCNLFDGCYELMMQMMGRLLLHSGESEEQLMQLSDIAVAMMMDIISPLGVALTKLPAGPSHPDLTAGPSFRSSREMRTLPHQTAAWAYFAERLKELSAYSGFLQAPEELSPLLGKVRVSLAQYVEQLSAV
jgi:hypothetical protein